MTTLKAFVAVIILIILPFFSQAQLSDTLKSQLIKDWMRSKAYTREYLDVMPADKYGSRPAEGVRSFSEQMLHLAQSSVGVLSQATGESVPDIFKRGNIEKITTLQSKDSVTYYVEQSYDFAISAVRNLDMTKALETVKIFGVETTRLAWVMKLFEHQAHHRGQSTIYIRMAGIKPPPERLF
jgi:uncharacterized damage-inducible protein DinB